MNRFDKHIAKTREGRIMLAFIKSLPELTPMIGQPPAVMRKKAWRVIRRRVPGVTQAVVTRTMLKMGKFLEWKMDYDKRLKRRRRA